MLADDCYSQLQIVTIVVNKSTLIKKKNKQSRSLMKC